MEKTGRANRLGYLIYCWRCVNEIGIREAAAQIGISRSTLSRVERGFEVDGATLAKILCWLLE